ncbi:unnamed protein product, partial [Darwinula stevensoni]
ATTCSLVRRRRIVGGKNTRPGEYPWMAALLRRSSIKGPFCGGSLISPIHVLTAAHCVQRILQEPHLFRVRIGEHDFESDFETEHKDFTIRRVDVHPDYEESESVIYNDLAVLELNDPCMDEPRTVCLPDKPGDYQNHKAIVVGWGTSIFGGQYEPILQAVPVHIFPHEECQSLYDGIKNTHLCAGDHVDGGKDACRVRQRSQGSRSVVDRWVRNDPFLPLQWDSGGPLHVCQNGKSVQVGVVSYGLDCGRPHEPGVYMNVSSHLAWIARVLRPLALNDERCGESLEEEPRTFENCRGNSFKRFSSLPPSDLFHWNGFLDTLERFVRISSV